MRGEKLRWVKTFVGRMPPRVQAVVTSLHTHGHQVYIPGGAVRDHLLRRPIKDWDLCTSAAPSVVREIFAGQDQRDFGLSHGFVTLRASQSGELPLDIYTLRGKPNDAKTVRKTGEEWIYTDDLGIDLQWRDFTINAMAVDPVGLRFYDPFGGRKDLERGLIRPVGSRSDCLEDNHLHAYRAVRIAAELDFRIPRRLTGSIFDHRHRMQTVSKELRAEEFMRMLDSPRPDWAVETLRRCGLLNHFLWELEEECRDVRVPRAWGGSMYEYLLNLCGSCEVPRFHKYPQYPGLLRLAVLVSAVGLNAALKTRKTKQPKALWTWYEAQRSADLTYKMICGATTIPQHVANIVADFMLHLHPLPMKFYGGDDLGAIMQELEYISLDGFLVDSLEVFIAVRAAQGVSLYPREIKTLRAQALSMQSSGSDVLTRRAIRGNEVAQALGITPGPELGECIRALKRKVRWDFAGQIDNKEVILAWLREHREDFLTAIRTPRSAKRKRTS